MCCVVDLFIFLLLLIAFSGLRVLSSAEVSGTDTPVKEAG